MHIPEELTLTLTFKAPLVTVTFLFFFNWRIIAFQNFVVFCHTSTRISHRYTYPCPLTPKAPSHLPTHPTLLEGHRAPVWVPWVIRQVPIGYLFFQLYFLMLLSSLQYIETFQDFYTTLWLTCLAKPLSSHISPAFWRFAAFLACRLGRGPWDSGELRLTGIYRAITSFLTLLGVAC